MADGRPGSNDSSSLIVAQPGRTRNALGRGRAYASDPGHARQVPPFLPQGDELSFRLKYPHQIIMTARPNLIRWGIVVRPDSP